MMPIKRGIARVMVPALNQRAMFYQVRQKKLWENAVAKRKKLRGVDSGEQLHFSTRADQFPRRRAESEGKGGLTF